MTGDIANGAGSCDTFWPREGRVHEKVRGTKSGDIGRSASDAYTFELIFAADLIRVSVDGNVEISYASADNGAALTEGSATSRRIRFFTRASPGMWSQLATACWSAAGRSEGLVRRQRS